MEKYEYEYMVTSIVINKADEIAKVLSGRFNQEGYEGTAKEQAMESEWIEIGDKHYCPDCYELDDELDEYVSKKEGDKNERT